MEVSGQLHSSAALSPGIELLVPIGKRRSVHHCPHYQLHGLKLSVRSVFILYVIGRSSCLLSSISVAKGKVLPAVSFYGTR